MKKIIVIGFCMLLVLIVPVKAQFIPVSDPILAGALCTKVPSAMSGDCLSLDTVAAASVTGTLQMQYYGFSDVKELRHFKSITFLQTVDNNITNLPNFTGFVNLTAIDIRGNPWVNISQLNPVKNQLTMILLRMNASGNYIKDFSFLNTFTNLKSIEFANFNAEVLPDFSLFTGLTLINVTRNKFTFKDLIPLTAYAPGLGAGNLVLLPQRTLTNDTNITVYCNKPYSLTIPIDNGVSGITYSFYKNNTLVQSSASNVLYLNTTTAADTGKYYVEIRSNNPFFGTDSLRTGNYTLKLNTSNDCQDLFSPNDDGFQDELFIEGSGEAVIRNKQGKLVRKLPIPGNWDGKDQHGNPVEIGVYLIATGSGTRTVTVLR